MRFRHEEIENIECYKCYQCEEYKAYTIAIALYNTPCRDLAKRRTDSNRAANGS